MRADPAATAVFCCGLWRISITLRNFCRPRLRYRQAWIRTGPGITRIRAIQLQCVELIRDPASDCRETARETRRPILFCRFGRLGIEKLCAPLLPENPECGVLRIITRRARVMRRPRMVPA